LKEQHFDAREEHNTNTSKIGKSNDKGCFYDQSYHISKGRFSIQKVPEDE
jgi:hypothetical protein